MELDFLQSIKLEISRSFTLNAYERIAFHKILSILKTESGLKILLRDLQKPGAIRKSALATLTSFESEELNSAFSEILGTTTDKEELRLLFEFFEQKGNDNDAEHLLAFFNRFKSDNSFSNETTRALFLAGKLGKDKEEYISLLTEIASKKESPQKQRYTAIEALDHYSNLTFYESLLSENNDMIALSVYKTIASFSRKEMSKYKTSDDELFSKTPNRNDNFLLNIRVLLSKMSNQFEDYSNETKVAYIKALLSCNHREYLVYISKALTTSDKTLIDMTLYAILSMINELENPDKLFRNLISLPNITQRDDTIIVEIFVTFFMNLKQTRSNNLIKDKLFNYIIVMLDNFFENYRKSFMIPEIIEKDYEIEIQQIRKFILNKLDPALKRRIIKYLTSDDVEFRSLIIEISEKISFIYPEEEEALSYLLEFLIDGDSKTFEILASRINDIDFEKRYLKHRIIRLCRIIGNLGIDEASSSLVKMFNYIKKYNDPEIYQSVSYALSQLNYPYMLGELEVLLTSSDNTGDKNHTIMLLSQFKEHRAIFIMLEYLKENFDDTSEITETVLTVLLQKDLKNDKSANEVAKVIAEKNRNAEIRALATFLIGKTGFEKDILYLQELFLEADTNLVKEAVIQAFDAIIHLNPTYRKKDIAPLLKGYLRDSSIKVRIFSCIMLLQMGDIGSMNTLKDMMVIKNKNIQREILLLLGAHITVELGFFLISLMKEEYAISYDIVPLLNYLTYEDKKEIDYFVTNIFKKHEGTRVESNQRSELERNQMYQEQIQSFKHETRSVLRIHLYNINDILTRYRSTELSMHFKKYLVEVADILKHYEGTVSRVTAGEAIVYFKTTPDTAIAALEILKCIQKFNYISTLEDQLRALLYIEYTNVINSNNELLFLHDYEYSRLYTNGLINRTMIEKETAEGINTLFNSESYPESAFQSNGTDKFYSELINPLNFTTITDEISLKIRKEIKRRKELENSLDNTQLKHRSSKSEKSLQLTDSLNDVGKLLKKDLSEIVKYIKKRSTDREMIRRTEKMLADVYKHYNVELSKLEIDE